jgi:hypothetical protein
VLNKTSKCLIDTKLLYCEWFFQIDFGDGNGSGIDFGTFDNGNTAGIECDGITVEEVDIDWGISTVASPGESGSEVYCFSHRKLFIVML